MKHSKPFNFNFPLNRKVVRDCKIVIEHVGDLEVSGTAYFNPGVSVLDPFERWTVDIDFVKWEGQDIKPVLEWSGAIDEIEEAASQHASTLEFNQLKEAI